MKVSRPYHSNRLYQHAQVLLLSQLITLAGLSHAYADNMWKDTLQYHGFITQAAIKTDENRFFGHSDEGSAAFTELGLNGSTRISNRLMASAQVLARRAGEMYDGSVELDYALLDYTLSSDADKRYGLRLGRFKNPLGLYNDTRDVAFTRPSLLLPQSVYFDNLRNAFLSNDGLLFYSEFWGTDSTVTFELGAGKIPVDLNIEYALLGEDVQGNAEDEDLTIVARLMYESGQSKLGLSYANTIIKMSGTDPVFVGDGEFDIDIWILSAQYSLDQWTLTAELAKQPIRFSNFSSFFPGGSSGKSNPGGGFIQASYQASQDWEFLVRYEKGYSDLDDKNGEARSALLASPPFFITSPAHNYFSKDWVVGARWDITDQFMLRAEYHSVEGTYFISRRENDFSSTIKDWNLFSILASFRF